MRRGTPGSHRRLVLTVLALAVVAALAVPFVGALRAPSQAGEPPFQAHPAPALAGPGLDGTPVDIDDLRGHVVLVNVWASWCAPCREEFPLLVATQRRLADDGLRVVGINARDDRDSALEFLQAVGGHEIPSVHDPDGHLAVEWGVRGFPETFVVDRDGQIVARRIGEVTAAWIESVVVPVVTP